MREGDGHNAAVGEETTELLNELLVCYWKPYPVYFWKTRHVMVGGDLIEVTGDQRLFYALTDGFIPVVPAPDLAPRSRITNRGQCMVPGQVVFATMRQPERSALQDPSAWRIVTQYTGRSPIAGFVRELCDRYQELITQYGKWKSFGEFLKVASDHDEHTQEPYDQKPLEYWWLIGGVDDFESVRLVSLYEKDEKGVFVEPSGDHRIPLYTSEMFAHDAATRFEKELGGEHKLGPCPITCLPCYIRGIMHEDGGAEAFRGGAILNGQWRIHFRLGGKAFKDPTASPATLLDTDNSYTLLGCHDTGGPFWGGLQWHAPLDHEDMSED